MCSHTCIMVYTLSNCDIIGSQSPAPWSIVEKGYHGNFQCCFADMLFLVVWTCLTRMNHCFTSLSFCVVQLGESLYLMLLSRTPYFITDVSVIQKKLTNLDVCNMTIMHRLCNITWSLHIENLQIQTLFYFGASGVIRIKERK